MTSVFELAAVGEDHPGEATGSPSSISWVVLLPVCTPTPSASIFVAQRRPPLSSTCTAIRRGANSTTWVCSAEVGERLGRFEAEQAAADDRAAAHALASTRGSHRDPRSCGRRSSLRTILARAAAEQTDTSRWRAPAGRNARTWPSVVVHRARGAVDARGRFVERDLAAALEEVRLDQDSSSALEPLKYDVRWTRMVSGTRSSQSTVISKR